MYYKNLWKLWLNLPVYCLKDGSVATDAYPANFKVTCQALDECDDNSETECKCALSSSCCQIVASFLGPVTLCFKLLTALPQYHLAGDKASRTAKPPEINSSRGRWLMEYM